MLLTYWNTVAFHSLYARVNGWTPTGEAPPVAERHVLDRWLVSATQQLIVDVTADLEDFDTQHAGALVQGFIDDLSNWYVRRSRRRFWDGDQAALWTLHETAPVDPVDVADRAVHHRAGLAGPVRPTDPTGPDSVHLTNWPTADESLIDAKLSASMGMARSLVELGRAASPRPRSRRGSRWRGRSSARGACAAE